MTAQRWLGVSLAIGIAAAAFTSCKSSTAPTSASTASGSGGAGTGGASGGSGGGTGGSADAGPLVCLQSYTNIKTGPCSLLDQNCAAGYTCVPALSNGTVTTTCTFSTGLKSAGEDCYSATECDAKLICIGQSATQAGKCTAFCCPAEPYEPCNGGICNEQVNFGNGALAYVCSYAPRCTLLTANACAPGSDCYLETAAGQGIAVCLAPSSAMGGELSVCSYLNDCASMQSCFGIGGGTSVCLDYCALTGSTTGAAPGLGGCPANEACESTYNGQPITIGVPNIGLCIPKGGIVPREAGAGPAPGDAGADADAG